MTAAVDEQPAPALEQRSLLAMGKHLLLRIKTHNVVIMSAGIAFYAVLALVPTLIALVSIYALVTDPQDISDQIASLVENTDEATADLVTEQLEDAVREAKGSSGYVALAIGIALALFAASGAVQKLMLSISMAYATVEHRKGWKVRGMAYLFTAGAIVGIVTIVFLLGALPALMDRIGMSGPTKVLINITRFPLLAVVFAGALTILYRYGPDRQSTTPWKNPGAVIGTFAFLVFAFAFSLYFAVAGGMPASYGILGSIAALIIFFQLCAIAVIIGAEVNATVEGEDLDPTRDDTPQQQLPTRAPAEPVGLGVAVLGLAAIFVLGRGGR